MSETETVVTDTPAATETVQETPAEESKAPETAVAEADGAEKPAEEPKKEDPEKEQREVKAKQLAYLQKQERKFQEQRRAFEAEVQEKTQQFNAAVERFNENVREYQSRVKQIEEAEHYYEQLVEQAQKDPVGWLQRVAGITPEEYVARVTQDGKPTPEYLLKSETAKLNKEWESKYGALQKKLEEHESWRKQLEEERNAWLERQKKEQEEAEERAEETRRAQARDTFWDMLQADKAAFGDLLVYSKDEVLAYAAQVVEELGQGAARLSLRALAEELQKTVAEQHKKIRAAGGVVQGQPQDTKAQEPAKEASKAIDPLDDAAEQAKKARVKTVPKGQVRTGQTLNGDMSARATVKATPDDRESRLRSIVAELSG